MASIRKTPYADYVLRTRKLPSTFCFNAKSSCLKKGTNWVIYLKSNLLNELTVKVLSGLIKVINLFAEWHRNRTINLKLKFFGPKPELFELYKKKNITKKLIKHTKLTIF